MINTEEKQIEIRKRNFSKYLNPKSLILLIACVVFAILAFGVKSHFSAEGTTTKLGFEDIGELATQSATCTSFFEEDKDRKILGVSIPFTQTKYIYTYDTVVKAGIDFNKVKVHKNGKSKEIYVDIPKIKILSVAVDYDSFKVYHEEESIFAPISMNEHNEAMKKLQKKAQKDAINNGLLDNAYDNAKRILKSFIEQTYDPNEYTINFSKQK